MNNSSSKSSDGQDIAGKGDPWISSQSVQDLFGNNTEDKRGEVARAIAEKNIPELKIISGSGSLVLYSRDQADVPDILRSILFKSQPDVVVQPFTIEAVQAVIDYAATNQIPVIIRGAGSSPFGGSMPIMGGIVLDINSLDHVINFDASKKMVKVQGGMRWADLDWFLGNNGLCVRSSPSSRFSTVGGWIATGGIGTESISGGHLSSSVKEMEVVTSSGGIRTLTPEGKEFHAIFGSEGQLAVVVSVTLLAKPKPASPSPRLVFFSDHSSAMNYAVSLTRMKERPMDLTYFSPGKFGSFNKILGKDHYPVAHGILATYESENSAPKSTVVNGAVNGSDYLAHLLWNERFFPMKFRKLGPGLMGSEVLAPRERLDAIVDRAQQVCSRHGLEPMIEIHFLENGDGMLLCYYITDQTKELKYTMDSFRGLLITSSLLEVGARPYSFGVWNHVFIDQIGPEERVEMEKAKESLDPANIFNQGKYPKLEGRLFGLPATLFSPDVLGSVLRLVNLLGPISAPVIGLISRGGAFDRLDKNDILLRSADECAMCGACVGVCPAYMVTKDERVTARGKLLTARNMANDMEVSKEHAHQTFLCMRCKACEQVCQSKLSLLPVYEELEKRLSAVHGRDEKLIKNFIQKVENSPAYDALIERGLVLGAASKNLDGGK